MGNILLISYCHCNNQKLAALNHSNLFFLIVLMICYLKSTYSTNLCVILGILRVNWLSGLFYPLEAACIHLQDLTDWESLSHNTFLWLSPSLSFTWKDPHYYTWPVQRAGHSFFSNASFCLDLPLPYNLACAQVWEIGCWCPEGLFSLSLTHNIRMPLACLVNNAVSTEILCIFM